jgi:iron complex outermembrane receptor protein
VEAKRERDDPSAFAVTIRPDEHRHRALTLPDLLRHAVGVDVRGFGGLGGFATVSIRGSTSEQVQIFLDGVLLSRAASGVLNLADLPLPEIERIEVYRGLTPARFGAAAPGGVIHLVSRSGSAKPRSTFTASYGSWNTFEFSLSHAGPHARGDFLALAHGNRSDGSFPFLDNNGTPLNPTDDATARRRNNGFASAGGLLKATVRAGGGLARFTLEGMGRTQGVPGIDALQAESATFDTWRVLAKADFERAQVLPGVNLAVSAFGTKAQDAFHDPKGELGLGPRETVTSTLTPGLTARLAAFPGRVHALTALVEYRHDGGTSRATSGGRALTTEVGRHSFALTAEDQITLAGGRLVLSPSARLDAVRSTFTGRASQESTSLEATGKLGLRVGLADGVALRMNGGRFFRVPTLTELFGDTGLVRGNPELRPELGYTVDAGLAFELRASGALRRASAEAVWFFSRYQDLIVFQLNSQGAAIAENQAAADVWGVELSGALDLGLGLSLSGGYTFQRATAESGDRTQGKVLPGRPQHKVSARAALTRGDFKVFYDLLALSGNFIDRLNRLELDARVLHGAGVAWRVLGALTVSAEVQNFTDNRVVDLYRFPLPGRSFFAKLAAEF